MSKKAKLESIKTAWNNLFADYISMNEESFNKHSKRFKFTTAQKPCVVKSDIRKNASPTTKTYRKEKLIESYLNERKYKSKKPLIIVNPYKMSPLSAIVVFNTKKPCSASYTVHGMRDAADYTRVSKKVTTRHRVPIIGLFEDATNNVTIELKDENGDVMGSKTFEIVTEKLPDTLKSKITPSKPLDFDDGTFLLITGGFLGSSYAFDNKCNIRYISSKLPYPYGYHLLSNGHFLYCEQDQRRFNYGNAHTDIMYEMDYMGRAYKTYHNKIGFHHWAIEEEGTGNFLQSSSSFDVDQHLENQIIEVDRNTGAVTRKINMNDYFDGTYDTRHDWAHINSFDYIYDEDAVIASLRNVHTIVKINLKTNKIEWILNNPEFYKGTEQESLCLKPEGHHDWFFQQHAVKILSRDPKNKTIDIILFDNHTGNRRPVDWFDGEKKSNVMIFRIDEKNKTVKQIKRFPTELSITRSNAVIVDNNGKKRVWAMCANLETHIKGERAALYEYDYETGEELNKVVCENDFFCTYFVDIDIDTMIEPIVSDESYTLGELNSPRAIKKLPEKYKTGTETADIENLKFRIIDDILQIFCKDHTLKRVYIYNDSHVYDMNFTDTKQDSKLFKKMNFYVSIPLKNIADGKYSIAIKHKKNFYKLPYYIDKKSN
ncbi:MAG: aryl-sulfate sulfotransferase [Lachnospiraceae bacterium]|nr:aryl-sulfate sulfotransferase [Lachnospiraceae bacterium]